MKTTGALSAPMKFRSCKRVGTILSVFGVVVLAFGVFVVLAADQFFAGDGSPLNAAKWGTAAAGPFTSAFASGSVANFATVDGTGTGSSLTVGGINATENFTLTAVSGTISNLSNGVVPVSVSQGKTLDFAGQVFTGSATAGYIKNGAGVLALAGGLYGGGFTLSAGTLIARGVNAMGGNAAPGALNINGGAIGADASRNFSGKYSGITIGGDFQLGVLSSAVPISSDTANLTFSNNVGLGATTRTINIGANGVYTLGGIISGNSGSGLTVANVPGATGRLTLSGANTYSGNTTISGGTLALSGSGSIAGSPIIALAGGATFDVSGRGSTLTLADSQTLKGTGTASSGTIRCGTSGLTMGNTTALSLTYASGNPTLNVTGGALTLAGGNSLTVTVSGSALTSGDYTLISKGTGGSVIGTAPTSLTVTGSGLAGGAVASLEINGQQLILHVVQPGALQLSSATYSVGEGGGLNVDVTRTGGSGGAVSVGYTTGGGTATASSDYTATGGTLNWAAGDTANKTINIPIADDSVYEGNESFTVTLASPGGGATLGTPSTATVTILDNEAVPTLSVSDVTMPEPASGISYASFVVTLSNASAQIISTTYATADGTATAPGDYTALSGTIGFSPGERSKTVAVAVKSDTQSEPDETFSLNLDSPVNAVLSDGSGVATITAPFAPGVALISEFRLRGPGGASAAAQTDEFVEVYNNTDADIVVTDANPVTCALQALDNGPATPCGWALLDIQGAASGNIPRFVIPAGTVIPARGHFLAAGTGYSLNALAAPDLTYSPPAYSGGEADFTGLALYNTADRAGMTPANVFDAVGFEGAALPFREGTGLLPSDGVTADVEHSFVRNQGSSRPADTGDNRADFTLVATDPAQISNGTAVLGVPGPENRTGPVQRNSGFNVTVPPGVTSSVRRTSPAVTNGTLGTLSLRRRFTNNTGQTLSKLRFRVADVSTWNSRLIFGNQAEMRVLDATLVGLSGTGLRATTLETPPPQTEGGGVNTGMLVNGSLVLAQPLAPGQSVDVEFLLGVLKSGSYQFVITVEAAP